MKQFCKPGTFFSYMLIASGCYFLLMEAKLENMRVKKTAHKVFRISPKSQEQLKITQQFCQDALELQLDCWKDSNGIGSYSDVMVSPKYQQAFLNKLTASNISYSVLIENLDELIQNQSRSTKSAWSRTLLNDDSSKSFNGKKFYNYNVFRYNSYGEMITLMENLERAYPSIAKVQNLGHTYEGRLIKMMKISFPLNSSKKQGIWIDAGMHAREWVSHVTAMYFIYNLITKYDVDPEITNYVKNFTWYIVPNVNPDGYEYSRSSMKPEVRSWRKNRSMIDGCSPDICCAGVDLNRNFDFHWGEFGSSDNRCSHIYSGRKAFSEKETQAVRDFVTLHRNQLDAFITLHSYSQFWLYPYGHSPGVYPYDVQDLRIIANRATKALKAKFGTSYKVGSSADMLKYSASGGSDDWVKSKIGVKFVYLIELRPDEKVSVGFIMDESQLPNATRETWEGVKVVADAVRFVNEIKAKRLQRFHNI